MNSYDIKLSKSLSWILRHGAIKEGLNFDVGGFINVEEILRLKQFKIYDISDIKRIVETNEKKRFKLRYKDNDNVLQIRANQGHSLKLDENQLLTPLSKDSVPSPIFHGTYFRCLSSIKYEGLNRMCRNHIHFTAKFPGDVGVISGMRQNCEIVIAIDSLKALSDGFKFYKSDNDVILCPGNESGNLPAIYISEIWQMHPLKKIL